MANRSMPERDTETLIDNILLNLGWIDNPKDAYRNVYKQSSKTLTQQEKLGGLSPDYILYKTNSDTPIAIIEAKRPKKDLNNALERGKNYAKLLNAPIVIATDGVFVKTVQVHFNEPLFLNGSEVDDFLPEVNLYEYYETNTVTTTKKKVIESRRELVKIFTDSNELLRGEGLLAGVDRFSEFSNILFLKILSEREDLDSTAENSIPVEFRWNFFSKKEGAELLPYINKVVLSYYRNKFKGSEVFSDIRIKNPTRLKKIIHKLDPLSLIDINSDIKGDAFEFFLKSYSSGENNDLGQYFTPRHIIKAVVKMLNPELGEKIYDPFCGTGGMLIECFKHISKRMPRNERALKMLREDTVYGNEITSISRIAKMNMILIGDGHSNIMQVDTLEKPVDSKYDVVITNIPFSQETEWGDLYDVPSGNGDSICIQHCLKALNKNNPNSRAGIIIPEGFLFDKKFKNDRKYLIDTYDLVSVISLPSGSFLPNTPQKASILYIKNKNIRNVCKKIKFLDIRSDGFTLDNYRKPLGKNDLENIFDSEKFNILNIEDIRNNNYQLVYSLYGKKGIFSNNTQTIKIKKIANVMIGNSAPQDLNLFENGTHPFVRVSDLSKEHISHNLTETRDCLNDEGIKKLTLFPKNTILIPKSGKTVLKNHRGVLGCPAYVVSHFACILPNMEKINPYYLFYCFLRIDANDLLLNEGYPSIRKGEFENISIPYPSIEKQNEIGSKIEKIVGLKKQIISLSREMNDIFDKL